MSGRLQIFSCVLYSELDDVTGPTQVPVTFIFHSFVSFVFVMNQWEISVHQSLHFIRPYGSTSLMQLLL